MNQYDKRWDMASNICLIGFMGSGKTTVGEVLAKKIGWHWVDLDTEIAKGENTSIANIFAQKGEAYFRSLETQYLKKALQQEDTVISTGGGIIVTPENVTLLAEKTTFYLYWKFDTLYQRIAGDTARPLATSYDEVHMRYKGREALYDAASKEMIQCEGKTVDEVVASILKALMKDGNDSLNEKYANL